MLRQLTRRLQRVLGKSPAALPQAAAAPPMHEPSAWLNEALRVLAAGDHAAVEAQLTAARNPPRERCEVEYLTGALALAAGDLAAAADHFQTALDAQADFAAAHCALGAAQRAAGRLELALASFRRATEIKHDYVEALLGQAETSFALDQREDAHDGFQLALAFAPDCVPALLGLARLLREAGAVEDALGHLQHAQQLAPGNAEVCFEQALTLNRRGDTQGALAAYRRALELKPDYVAALANLGLLYLGQLGEASQAQRLFERAAALDPDLVAAQANLGLALQDQSLFDAALAHYDRLIAAHPNVIEYRWNRAIAYLCQGDFGRGWVDYELRHTRGGRDVRRRFPLPEWDGDNPAGRKLLVYGEQGLGDEIMFASCVPDLLRLAGGVVLECDARLGSLFQRSFPAAAVHGARRDADRGWLNDHPQLDGQIAIGSLPRYLRRSVSAFPRHHGYLVADPGRIADWKSRLAERGGSTKIGLSWRGGTRGTRAEMRSLTFTRCMPWLAVPNRQFICLQRGDCGEEIAAAKQQGVDLAWWPQALDDADELAALIAALDLVISVDNTTAHLAGALGQRCWVLLPKPADWRYGWQGETMPWYPSLRLFRQTRPGDWEMAIGAVTADLDRLERH